MYHPSLSWEAIGVFCWAQTQPTFTLKNLLRTGTGRDRAYRILRELLTLGYLERFERRDESGKFVEYGYRVSRPNPEGPEAGPTRKATPRGENPEAAPLPENPLRANPEAAECLSCTEQSTQGRFPLTAEPEAAPAERSKSEGIASCTEIEPLREKAQTENQPLFFKSLKEEILNELLSALNKQLKEELLTELLSAVNSSLSKKKPGAKAEPRPTPGKPEARPGSGKPDAVAELAASLGLSDWQRNFARSAVKEEASRTAWFGLARNHPEVLKASYRLLDKTGQRTPVAWVAWLPHLAEDVKQQGADAVRQCLEKAITSASPAGAWGYYRACLQGGSRSSAASAYERLAPEYRIVKRIPGKETVYAQ